MLVFLQQDNQHLQQQLLEAPKYSKFDVDAEAADVDAADVENSVGLNPQKTIQAQLPQPVDPVDYVPTKSSNWGLGISLCAVAAAIIFYVLTSDQGARFFPDIQQKPVGALHSMDTM
jgi:hypothetical protein